jgi:hypothetical protein
MRLATDAAAADRDGRYPKADGDVRVGGGDCELRIATNEVRGVHGSRDDALGLGHGACRAVAGEGDHHGKRRRSRTACGVLAIGGREGCASKGCVEAGEFLLASGADVDLDPGIGRDGIYRVTAGDAGGGDGGNRKAAGGQRR